MKVRKQETVKKGVQCFRYWRVGHYKWECPNIKVEKERRRSEKVVCAVRGKAGMLFIEKGTGVLWQEGYTPKGCSSRRARMEDKVEGGNICRVWGV